ncbi:hypothetical protein [Persicobacter sp. CCB-QB2]|uniref:hypothetical protein n=1 Tax=Persicobacter sp. CCB-QB2 TaxID=1561025 RepID=UPI0006A9AF2A|nr:hypothetical protein [Persicobacter sp. CCB-QB2]
MKYALVHFVPRQFAHWMSLFLLLFLVLSTMDQNDEPLADEVKVELKMEMSGESGEDSKYCHDWEWPLEPFITQKRGGDFPDLIFSVEMLSQRVVSPPPELF